MKIFGLSLDEAKSAINVKLNEIITHLSLNPVAPADIFGQLEAAVKVHRFVAMHNTYQDSIMDEKARYEGDGDALSTYDLYQALVHQKAVCTSNSLEVAALLGQVKVIAFCVYLESSDGGGKHMANLVLIGGHYYYFDATLERYTHEQANNDPDYHRLYVAGLGRKFYEKLYAPLGVVNLHAAMLPDLYLLADPEDIPHSVITMALNR
ncbi:hypothetical protein IJJ08_00870 [bacterium]|nr:hypothetical protein [bacterium]